MQNRMVLANRVAQLGIETAFVVAARAAAHAEAGKRVYPFHLGDLNLATPANIVESACAAMRAGKTGYTPNLGIPELREALAEMSNRTRGTSYRAANVAVQPGGKPVIAKFLLTLMNPGDEVLYPNPGFPIYSSQIEFHGGVAVPYTTVEQGDSFTFDVNSMENGITERTALLIVNDLHNPTGAECTAEQRRRIAELAVRHNLMVLLDEAYFDVRYEGESASLVTEPGMAERTIILYTFSKRYAMTGWRLGAAFGPEELIEVIGKLNVNDESCTNHFVQWAGVEALTGDQQGAQDILETLRSRRNRGVELLNNIEGVHCLCPKTTFYLWADITDAMRNKGIADTDLFSQEILRRTGVAACARSHFGQELSGETHHYLRLAYAGIDLDAMEEGLGQLKNYLES